MTRNDCKKCETATINGVYYPRCECEGNNVRLDFIKDINKIDDIFTIAKDDFLNSFSYLKEEEFEATRSLLLKILFTQEQIKERQEFVKSEREVK